MTQNHYQNDPFKGTFGNLENLVDKISDVLQRPITIEDANHRLLAYSSHEERTDPARVATIIGRRVPEKVINSLWRDGVIPKLNQSEEPLSISEISDIGLGARVAIGIFAKKEVLGYIWVLELDNRLSEKELSLLKSAAQTAKSQLLQLQIRKKKKEEGHQEFFWQLLTGHLKSHQEIENKIQELGMITPTPISVILFQFEHDISAPIQRHISYMITTTQKLLITFQVIDRNKLILLGSPHKEKENRSATIKFIEDFVLQMNKRFKVSQIKGSCGNPYNNYEKIEASYQEALTVLRLKNQFPVEVGTTYNYQQLGVYRYLDVLLEKKKQDGYENTSLQKLSFYDEANKTELLKTLEVFLNKDGNVQDAAKELNVHTNTLSYRLKRIIEVGDIDLKSPNQKITLYIDIKLNKLS